jgi:hypothetical protein
MENFQKLEGIDYTNNFAKKINSMHQLVAKNLQEIIKSDNVCIFDLGGGPGIGASIIDRFEKKVRVINIEPSVNIEEIPNLKYVEYLPLKLSFKDALEYQFPYKADIFLMISAAHEIALSNGKSSFENKEIFYMNLNIFLKKNANPNALLSIGFPNYKIGATEREVLNQREFIDSSIGHSHPPDEFFTIKEFSTAFSTEAILFDQTPMILSGQTEEETTLVANFAVFKVSDILKIN